MPPHQYFYQETISRKIANQKVKVDPFPHEMRLFPTGHQPSISWSWGNYYYYHYYYHYYYYYFELLCHVVNIQNGFFFRNLGEFSERSIYHNTTVIFLKQKFMFLCFCLKIYIIFLTWMFPANNCFVIYFFCKLHSKFPIYKQTWYLSQFSFSKEYVLCSKC